MIHELHELPYSVDALAPAISAETMSTHWGKHHRGYLATVNKLAAGTPLSELALEEVIEKSEGALQNAAAQAWNHDLLWRSMTPATTAPSPELERAIAESFGSRAGFLRTFRTAATALFGSGWTWLVRERDGKLAVLSTPNAGLRIHDDGFAPLLVCDVWEHAYYLDYRNERGRYVDAFLDVLDWKGASTRFAKATRDATGGAR